MGGGGVVEEVHVLPLVPAAAAAAAAACFARVGEIGAGRRGGTSIDGAEARAEALLHLLVTSEEKYRRTLTRKFIENWLYSHLLHQKLTRDV